MKLQNDQTGQVENFCIDKDQICSCDRAFVYDSLAQLQEAGWEDYEEPETYYIVGDLGNIESSTNDHGHNLPEEIWHKALKRRKEIGNYFETEEEAKQAVEKLKAWQRLKDKGFERVFSLGLGDALCGGKAVAFELLIDDENSIKDIKLLFGGEE